MTFALTIRTEGAAFNDPATEVGRILCQVADKLRAGDGLTSGVMLDMNGNTCGVWGFQSEEERPNA